jgi:hypothetical protein
MGGMVWKESVIRETRQSQRDLRATSHHLTFSLDAQARGRPDHASSVDRDVHAEETGRPTDSGQMILRREGEVGEDRPDFIPSTIRATDHGRF